MYPNVNEKFGRSWWDYDGLMVSWGVQDSYEVVRKVGRGKVSTHAFTRLPSDGLQKGAREGSEGSSTSKGRGLSSEMSGPSGKEERLQQLGRDSLHAPSVPTHLYTLQRPSPAAIADNERKPEGQHAPVVGAACTLVDRSSGELRPTRWLQGVYGAGERLAAAAASLSGSGVQGGVRRRRFFSGCRGAGARRYCGYIEEEGHRNGPCCWPDSGGLGRLSLGGSEG